MREISTETPAIFPAVTRKYFKFSMSASAMLLSKRPDVGPCKASAATLSDMHSAVTSAIGALKGPLHGGANEAVFKILMEIDKAGADPVEYVKGMLAQKKKVPGFGHRVYHTEDPRATHLRKMSRDLGNSSGNPKWFEYSRKIELVAPMRQGRTPSSEFASREREKSS